MKYSSKKFKYAGSELIFKKSETTWFILRDRPVEKDNLPENMREKLYKFSIYFFMAALVIGKNYGMFMHSKLLKNVLLVILPSIQRCITVQYSKRDYAKIQVFYNFKIDIFDWSKQASFSSLLFWRIYWSYSLCSGRSPYSTTQALSGQGN